MPSSLLPFYISRQIIFECIWWPFWIPNIFEVHKNIEFRYTQQNKSNLKHVHIQVIKQPFNSIVADILNLEKNLMGAPNIFARLGAEHVTIQSNL